jgi:hypothetical protein
VGRFWCCADVGGRLYLAEEGPVKVIIQGYELLLDQRNDDLVCQYQSTQLRQPRTQRNRAVN